MVVPLHWHTEPWLLCLILALAWLYALCVGPLRTALAPRQAFPTGCCVAFALALIIGYLAVGSPLDQLGEDFLFSAHMLQHLLLAYVVAPLFVVGLPAYLQNALLGKHVFLAVLTHPLVGGVLFTALYTLWHHPVLYEAALQNKTIHVVEHFCMFLPACLMWWPILSKSTCLPRSSYAVLIIYAFLLALGQTPLFAFLVFSEQVLYPTYAFAPRIFNITALQDQLLGGVLMKLVTMAVTIGIIATSFTLWYLQERAEDPDISAKR